MKTSLGKTRLRQAVGSFDDAAGLHDILQVLADQDVPLADLTVLVGRAALDDRLVPYQQTSPGTVLDHVLASMSTIGMTKGAGPLLVSSTPFSDFLIGAGDTVETSEPFLAHWLSAPHAGYLQQQLDAGAALLCIHVRNGEEEKRAGRALLQHSRHQVQMHDFSFP